MDTTLKEKNDLQEIKERIRKLCLHNDVEACVPIIADLSEMVFANGEEGARRLAKNNSELKGCVTTLALRYVKATGKTTRENLIELRELVALFPKLKTYLTGYRDGGASKDVWPIYGKDDLNIIIGN